MTTDNSEIPKVTNRSKPLCPDCQTVVTWTREPGRRQDDCLKFQFKPNMKTLRLSALECLLCQFVLYKVFDGQIFNKYWTDEETLPYTVQAQPHGELSQGLFEVFWEETLPYPSPTITIPAYYYLTDPTRIGKRAVWQEDMPTFDSRLQTLTTWISDCECHHAECVEDSSDLPRRLLDLSGLEQSGKVKLIESSTITNKSIKYATLSHCWGPPTSKPPLKTTKLKYVLHSQGISLKDLTLNFHDAVLVCRKIGLDYIWIDSLCIIQDDSTDWEVEAAKMADVYRGGYLNIAVNAAPDAHGGIINMTALQPSQDRLTSIRYTSDETKDEEILSIQTKYGARENLQRSVENYPYLGRGWVLQELALSLRSVHFLRGQMLWQCRHCFTSEDGTLWQREFSSLFGSSIAGGAVTPEVFDFGSPLAAHNIWMWWVQSYSTRQLTYASDVGNAIAGLIDYFRRKTGYRPMLGLWRETLAVNMHWNHRFCVKKPQTNMFPSWSWLSRLPRSGAREVLYLTSWPKDTPVVSLCVDLWEEKWVGVPYTSKLESSRLVVSSFARTVTIPVSVDKSLTALVVTTGPDWNGGTCRYESISYLEHGVSHLTVKMVHLFQYFAEDQSIVVDAVLILRPSHNRPGCYERLSMGWIEMKAGEGWERGKHWDVNFGESQRELIEIV